METSSVATGAACCLYPVPFKTQLSHPLYFQIHFTHPVYFQIQLNPPPPPPNPLVILQSIANGAFQLLSGRLGPVLGLLR